MSHPPGATSAPPPFSDDRLPELRDLVVERQVLDNGATVLVHPAPGTSLACFYCFVAVGSRDDPVTKSGLAHLLEHLMFQGTERYGAQEFDRILEASGGESNAYTTHDRTVYHDAFSPDALEIVLDMEADRHKALALTNEILDKERDVILEERRSALEDSPYGRMLEALYETALAGTPYAWPVMGRAVDLGSITIDDCVKHHSHFHRPENLVLVVAGDIEATSAIRAVDRTFGRLDHRRVAPPSSATAPRVRSGSEQRVTLRMETESPAVLLGYPIPSVDDEDLLALDAIAAIFGEGRSSRLYRNLVDRDHLALDFEVDVDELLAPGLFATWMQARDGVTTERLEEAWHQEVVRLRSDLPTDDEMTMFRNVTISEHLRSLKTVSGRAELIGHFESLFGDHRGLEDVLGHYESVTAPRIVEVARKYFDRHGRTTIRLEPAIEKDATESASEDAR